MKALMRTTAPSNRCYGMRNSPCRAGIPRTQNLERRQGVTRKIDHAACALSNGKRRFEFHRNAAPVDVAAFAQEESESVSRPCTVYDLSDSGEVDYARAWALQKELVASAKAALDRGESPRDVAVLLEHAPVYTLGSGSTLDNLKFDVDNPPFPLYRTERGGEVTYHGPGQLVLYPILDLRAHGQDLHLHMRNLEETVIRTLMDVSGIEGRREEGLTGVWTDSGKVAALGIRATRWISYHGVALNVAPALEHFDAIVPCGIEGRSVASVETVLGSGTDDREEMWLEYRYALLESFAEVYGLELVDGNINDLGII